MSLQELTSMSNDYGRNAELVLAGGGNTSWKDENLLYVKGSGTSLATITAEGFVAVYRDKVSAMLTKEYPTGDAQREAACLADLLDARAPGQGEKRPSVETILHNLFSYKLVLHVHPALVNGLTCGAAGEEAARSLFGTEALWIDSTRPGYVLSMECSRKMQAYQKAHGRNPQLVLLQNHGVFVAADTRAEIDALVDRLLSTLGKELGHIPDLTPLQTDTTQVQRLGSTLEQLYAAQLGSGCAQFCSNPSLLHYAASRQQFSPLADPFTPDHIVYCKAKPLYIEDAHTIPSAFAAFVEKEGYAPKIVVVKDLGMFALGQNQKEGETAQLLFLDAVKIAVYSQSFGGPLHMTPELVDFIVHWEMESYRQKVSLK